MHQPCQASPATVKAPKLNEKEFKKANNKQTINVYVMGDYFLFYLILFIQVRVHRPPQLSVQANKPT